MDFDYSHNPEYTTKPICLGLKPDSDLRLIVKWAIKTTVIQVYFHFRFDSILDCFYSPNDLISRAAFCVG
jgi:hypothetical protein